MAIDTLLIKLMSLAVHAEEYLETGHHMDRLALDMLLSDPEVQAERVKLGALALLPVKRSEV